MLSCQNRENATHIEVKFTGALTLREVQDAYRHVEPLWQKQKIVMLNLAGVTDLDTIGFQVLLYWKITARRANRKLRYVNHSSPVLAALDLFGAVAEFGDKIKLTGADRQRFAFKYGTTRA